MSRCRLLAAAFVVWTLVLIPPGARAADEAAADEALLREQGVGADVPGLLAFFRGRTPTAEDLRRVETWIQQLADERFEAREEASRELARRGPVAVPFLRKALRHADAEVARRAARCLEELQAGPGPALPRAAARLLARRAPAEASAVLLGYLPFADDSGVEDEVLQALVAAFQPVKEEKLWQESLDAKQSSIRGAAAFVLARKGTTEQRAAVRRLLSDADLVVRFRAAEGLLNARDPNAVPVLIALLEEAPLDLAVQAEELLGHLAGEGAPRLSVFEGDGKTRPKCRAAWAAWWAGPGAKVDLARAAERERLLGLTLGIEYNTGRVWECGPDGTLRWELTNLQGPMEAQVLPGGRVLVAESNSHTVSERDFKGNVLWKHTMKSEPTGCQRLANGNTFISTYNTAMEVTRDGKEVYSFTLTSGSNAIIRHRNGHVLYAIDGQIVEEDATGRKVRTVPLPKATMYVGIQDLPGDRFLLANSSTGEVLEVDAAGKVLWKANVAGACGVARLPNGHTLVAAPQHVVELNREGKQVWEKKTPGYARRVHRR